MRSLVIILALLLIGGASFAQQSQYIGSVNGILYVRGKLSVGDTLNVSVLGTAGAQEFGFITNGIVRGKVTASGNWEIGSATSSGALSFMNTSSDTKLVTYRTGGNQYSIMHDAAKWYVYNNTASRNAIEVANAGGITLNGNTAVIGTLTASNLISLNNATTITTTAGTNALLLRRANSTVGGTNYLYYQLQNSGTTYVTYGSAGASIEANTAGAHSGSYSIDIANASVVDTRVRYYYDGSMILQNGGTFTKTAGVGLDVLSGSIRLNAARPITLSSGTVTVSMDGSGGWAGGIYTKPSTGSASEGLIGVTGGTTTTSHIWLGGADPANPWVRIDKQTVDNTTKFRILNSGEVYMYAGMQVFAGNLQVTSGRAGIGGTPDATVPLKVYGAILTAQSSANGAGAWKLGKKVNATVALVTSEYVEIEVDGVVKKLAVVN